MTPPSAQPRQARTYDNDEAPYLGNFDPARYHLTLEQAWQCDERLALKQRQRPLQGFRWAQRVRGILRAVKAGWVGNRRHGYQLLGARGGRITARRYRAVLQRRAPLAAAISVTKRTARALVTARTPTRGGLGLWQGRPPTDW